VSGPITVGDSPEHSAQGTSSLSTGSLALQYAKLEVEQTVVGELADAEVYGSPYKDQ
jgi:hypothetical protein